jgi:hypothetical protein
MTSDADRHASRADSVADSVRTHVLAFNTGGIGVCFAAAASLAEQCVNLRWVIGPVALFTAGLVVVAASLLLQKHKALKRRDAAREGRSEPNFKPWYWRNFTWDLFALGLFCGGVAFALINLSCIHVGCQVSHG